MSSYSRWLAAGAAGVLVVGAATSGLFLYFGHDGREPGGGDAESSKVPVFQDETGEKPVPDQPFGILKGKQLGMISYTAMRLRDGCMLLAGYPEYQEAQLDGPVDEFRDLVLYRSDFGPPSVDYAEKHGMGRDRTPEPGEVVGVDDERDAKFSECEDEGWAELGDNARGTYSSYSGLMYEPGNNQFLDDSGLSEDVRDGMYGCLRDRGYEVDPDRSDEESWVESVGVKGGKLEDVDVETADEELRSEPGTHVVAPRPPQKYLPSAAEVEFAVVWVGCDEKAGYLDATFDVLIDKQREYLEPHRAEIEALNSEVERVYERALVLVEEFG